MPRHPVMLWLRARRASRLIVAAGLLVLAGGVIGDRQIAQPTFFAGVGAEQMLVTTLLPLAWAAAIADGFSSRRLGVELRPVRRRRLSHPALADVVLFGVLTAVSAVGFSSVVVIVGSEFAGIGPMLAVSGLTCALTVRYGAARAMFATTALTVGQLMYGMRAPGGRYVNFLLLASEPRVALGCGIVLCALAGGLLITDHVAVVLRSDQLA